MTFFSPTTLLGEHSTGPYSSECVLENPHYQPLFQLHLIHNLHIPPQMTTFSFDSPRVNGVGRNEADEMYGTVRFGNGRNEIEKMCSLLIE